ncbi:MAG: hypothetical protein ACE5R6_01470 [Candidatus Heimdallarchaeota archaeon]
MPEDIEFESPAEKQTRVISRLFATETNMYVLIFFGVLGALLILTLLRQSRFVLILGIGALLAFLVIMILAISNRVYDLFLDKTLGTLLGLGILGLFITLVWYFVRADNVKLTLLSYVVSVIFLIWTLAQAYFMSMPISKVSAQVASKFKGEPKSHVYSYMVLSASVVLPVIYLYLSLKLLPRFVNEVNKLLTILWVIGMIFLVGFLWILVIRFLRPIMDKQDAIFFGGVFFAVYMLFIFYHSLFFLTNLHEPTSSLIGNILDVLFMIVTILYAIYSFSRRAFRTQLPGISEKNAIFLAFAFGAGYASAQLFYIASAADLQASISRISMTSHLLILVCALFMLLFTPYSYAIASGYIVPTPFREAFSLRKKELAPVEQVVEEAAKEAPVKEISEAETGEEVIREEGVREELGEEDSGKEESVEQDRTKEE